MVGSLGAAPNSFGSLVPIPDPFGLATITIRDLTHVPQAGASVVIDFSGCSDIRICCDQADVECIVCCIDKTVKKLANVLGQVSFIVLGGSTGSGNATSLQGCARIYANGVLLRTPTSSCFDLDGANGVGINDLSVWLTDFGNGTSAASCTLASPGPALMNRGDGSSAALVSCPKNQPIQNQSLESCPRLPPPAFPRLGLAVPVVVCARLAQAPRGVAVIPPLGTPVPKSRASATDRLAKALELHARFAARMARELAAARPHRVQRTGLP